jgi:hypothetical protein
MSAEAWSAVFLGIVAASTLALAIGAGLAAVHVRRAVRRLEQAITEVQTEVRPLIERATVVTGELARMTALVTRQVERADEVLAEVTGRLEELAGLVQTAIVRPAREIVGVVSAVRAVVDALRGVGRGAAAAGREEDDEALFIG